MKFIGRKSLNIGPGEKILVRAHHWIGDVILCTPALRAVRESFPDAHISVTAKPWVIPILCHNPHIDEIICYNRTGLKMDALGVVRFTSFLRTLNFSAAILFRRSFEAALSGLLAGIPIRMGYNTDGRGALLTHKAKVTYEETRIHRVEDDLRLLEGFGIESSSTKLVLCIDPLALEKAVQRLRQLGFSEDDRILGISPGSKGALEKRWYPDHFAEIIRRIHECYGAKCILFGASFERELGDRIASMAEGSDVVNLAGEIELDEALALVSLCGQFLSNDSGLMHAAAALGVPLGAVFGPTDFRRTAPWSEKSRLIRQDLDCFNCVPRDCPFTHRCMQELSVEYVYRVLQDLANHHGFDALGTRLSKTVVGANPVAVVWPYDDSASQTYEAP